MKKSPIWAMLDNRIYIEYQYLPHYEMLLAYTEKLKQYLTPRIPILDVLEENLLAPPIEADLINKIFKEHE